METNKVALMPRGKKGGLRDYLVSGVMVAVFIIAVISGYNSLAFHNNANNLLLQDQKINSSYVQYLGNLSALESTANQSKTAFESENPSFTSGFLLFGSVITGVKNFMSAFIGIFIIMFDMLASVTGIPPIILSIFSAIMIILLIFMAWRVYKLGS